MKKLITFFALLFLIPMILFLITPHNRKEVLSKKIVSPLPTIMLTPTPVITNDPRVKEAVENILKERDGTYGVFYKDMTTNATYEKNPHMKFYSASLYKLWVMGELFRQIDQGKIKKEEVLTKSIPVLNRQFNLASDEADLAEGTVEFTVDDALENMITVSSNVAALVLSDRLKTKNIADFLKTSGFSDSSFDAPPKTSPRDIGMYFQKLYNHQLVAPIYTKEMIAILERQQLNDRLPKYLPESIQIAHKTGELNGYKHDAGIIYHPKRPYILVVLSKSNDESYAAETIAMISREIYRIKDELN